ncbi:MAG: signal peptidase II [Candidatus Omnitrophica bacterium]|nr:signal peptidase II [Candidatus Omnitrophota bacterium]
MRPWLISGLTLAADQLTKFVVAAAFHPGESRALLPGVLHLTYIQNTGAAFGLLKGWQLLFIGLSLAVIAWILRQFLAQRPLAATTLWAYALILGGAAGNLIDRLRFGYVVDFIDVRVWPVFNLGDSAITIGVGLLVWRALRKKGSNSLF